MNNERSMLERAIRDQIAHLQHQLGYRPHAIQISKSTYGRYRPLRYDTPMTKCLELDDVELRTTPVEYDNAND